MLEAHDIGIDAGACADDGFLESLSMHALASARPACVRDPVRMEYVRDATLEDVLALTAPDRTRLPAPLPITQDAIRQRHHLLARSLALGASPQQAAAETGYAASTITRYLASPAFVELVQFYEAHVEAKLLDVAERRAQVGTAALEELQERFEDPEQRKQMSVKSLAELVKAMLGDRVGATPAATGASTSPVNVLVQFVAPSGEQPMTITSHQPEAISNG